eukprot:COSAG05_NODE_1083_length_5933_cov_3.284196_7_plen_63_part_00
MDARVSPGKLKARQLREAAEVKMAVGDKAATKDALKMLNEALELDPDNAEVPNSTVCDPTLH